MASGNSSFFTWFYTQFETVISNYFTETSSNIVSAIAGPAWVMMGIYFALWGFSMVRGLIDEPLTDGLFRMVKISIVLGLALNTGLYQTHVVDFIQNVPGAMAQLLVFGGGNAESGTASTFATLDMLLVKTQDLAYKCWDQMSILSPGQSLAFGICALIILGMGLFFLGVAGLGIIITKLLLMLMLALGPIFILLAMFQATQRFFDAWIAQTLTAMMTLVLIMATCSLFFAMVEEVIGQVNGVIQDDPLQGVGIITLAAASCTFLLMKIPAVASSLAGGVALQVTEAASRMNRKGGEMLGKAASKMGANTLGKAVGQAVMGKATGGVSTAISAATKAAGMGFRATNTIRRG